MNTTLEYIEQVLTKVSFDGELFEGILIEAIASLDENLLAELKNWCVDVVGSDQAGIIISYVENNM